MDPWRIILPVITFVGGFLVRTFIPTSKERFDMRAQRTKNSKELTQERDIRYGEFVEALDVLVQVQKSDNQIDRQSRFWEARKRGDLYFSTLEQIASYILRGDIDPESAQAVHIPELLAAAQKAIPHYYTVLNHIAERSGLSHTDQLTASSFRNLRRVLQSHMDNEAFARLLESWGLPPEEKLLLDS